MAKEKLEKTNAMRILDQKKVAYKEHTLGIIDAVSGVEAASLLGVDESLVFKTLVTVGKVWNTTFSSSPWHANWT